MYTKNRNSLLVITFSLIATIGFIWFQTSPSRPAYGQSSTEFGPRINNVLQISSRQSTCALFADNTIQCWGNNNAGVLGNGESVVTNYADQVVNIASGMHSITRGGSHICGALSNGQVQCWGYNGYGSLGNGDSSEEFQTPVYVRDIESGVIDLDAGDYHTCVIDIEGNGRCWGENNFGQLGVGDQVRRYSPTLIEGEDISFQNISAGDVNTCAVTTEGLGKCWGLNDHGQIGNGTTDDYSNPYTIPSDVVTTALFKRIETYRGFACGLTESKEVLCWGENSFGQLGDGTNESSSVPVKVIGLSNVTQISVGSNRACALLENGGVKCWGLNAKGLLGDGTEIDQNVPVNVVGLGSKAIQVELGERASCALLDTGEVQCWGSNQYGDLGNGTWDDSLVPTYVIDHVGSVTPTPTPMPIPGQDTTVLVYVHGWQGMSDIGSSCLTGALKYDPSSANLPDPGNVPLLAWLYDDGWEDIYSLHWNTSSEHSDSIKDAGACIAGQIEALKAQYPTDTQFVLLTHSMGGPNSRWYLESGQWPNSADRIKSLIMLGAPNMGLLERTSTVCKGLSILSHQITVPDDACNLNEQVDFFELHNDDLDGITGILDGTGKPETVDYFVINGDSDSVISQIAKWSIAGDGEYPMDFLVPTVSGIKLPNAKRFVTMEDHSQIPGGNTVGIQPYYGNTIGGDRTESYSIVTDILDGDSYTEASESAMTRAQDVIDSDSFKKEYPSHDILNANMAPLDSYMFKANLAYGKGLIVVNTGGHDVDFFVKMPDGTFFDPLQVSHDGVTAAEGENYIAVRVNRLQSPGDWQFSLLNNDPFTQNYWIAIWYGNPVFADATIPDIDIVMGQTVELLFGLGLQSAQLQAASVSTETISSVVVTITAPDGTDMIFDTQSVSFTPTQSGVYVIDFEVNSINQSGDSVRRIDSRSVRVLEVQSSLEFLYLPMVER